MRLDSNEITEVELLFNPISLMNLFNDLIHSRIIYSILNQLNLFEVIWCVIVIQGLMATIKLRKTDAILLVLSVWVLVLLFQSALMLCLAKVNLL